MGGYAAAYDENTNETYLNTEGTDISRGGEIIKSLFWEAQRKDNTTNGLNLNSDQQLTLASSRGDQAGNLWNRFSETANTTPATIADRAAASNWNSSNSGSSTLISGSSKADNLVTGEGSGVVPRSKPIAYTAVFEEFDKKGTVKVITERVDEGDTLNKFIEEDVNILTAMGIKTDFDKVKAEYLKNNPHLAENPNLLKEGERIITGVSTSMEKTLLGNVIDYLPRGEFSASNTSLALEDRFGRGGGLTISGSGDFIVNGDLNVKGSLNPTVGIGPKTAFSLTGGFAIGDGKTSGTVAISINNRIVEIDYGTNRFGIRSGYTSSIASITYTTGTPILSKEINGIIKTPDGSGALIKQQQQKVIQDVYKMRNSNLIEY